MWKQTEKAVAIPRQEVPLVKGWFTLTKANGIQSHSIGTASHFSNFLAILGISLECFLKVRNT